MAVLKARSTSTFFQVLFLLVFILVFSGYTIVGHAQSTSTNIQISGRVQQSSVSRLGVNLSDQTYWDSGQMMKSLIFENPGFEGLKYREIFQCAFVTAKSCTDNNQGNTQPAGFWNSGHFQVMSGNAVGATGTVISHSAAGSCSGCGPTFQFDKSLDLAVGDFLSIEIYTPGSGDAGWRNMLSGGGTISTETTDLSPQTPGKQALLLSASRPGQSVTLSQDFGTLEGLSRVQLNGTFQITFRAKAVGGNNQLNVNLARISTRIAPYVNQTVTLANTWKDYTLSFAAAEAEAALGRMQLSFTATGANVELDDVSLAQANSSPDNPTVFRDEVVNALKEMNPGTIRMAAGSGARGSDILNQLQAPFARYREGFSPYETTSPDIAYGIHELLQLCAAVGADPWITIPTATTPQEMTEFIQYLTGNGSDPWSALRITRGQVSPWTSVFAKIHIELDNEPWNGEFAGESIGSPAYAEWANKIFGAARQTTGFEAENFDLILSGSASSPRDNATMLTYSTQHDSFDIAPFLLLSANNEASEKMFGALFAEPELFDSPGGEVYQNIQVGTTAPSATAQSTTMDVYETDLSPIEGSITQAQMDQLTPSLGAGMAQTAHMLQMMRIGAKYQNAFALARNEVVRGNANPVKLLGRAVDMGTTNRRGPHFLMQALANSVIGGDMLQTIQSGANPTWDQPLSSDNVQLNGAHCLQSFAFLKGTSASVVIFNLNQSTALPVRFSGPHAPAGTVQMTLITSGKIADNNETSTVVQPVTQTLSGFNPETGLNLPPFSMTLLTWTSDAVQTPTFSVPAGAYGSNQAVALSTTTPGATIYYTTDGSTPTTASARYTGALEVRSTGTLKAVAVLADSASSAVATSTYDIHLPAGSTISPIANGSNNSAPITAQATRGATTQATAQITGQTTVTISNTVQQAFGPTGNTSASPHFGVNMGGAAPYGQGQTLKSFNPYGYMQSAYWQSSYTCTAGGTNDATHWYNNATDTGGYPANFWVGATYIAVNASNGTSYGTGTITASTANTGSTGIQFTLGTPLSSACSTSEQDMLIVKFTNAPQGLITPQQFGIDACPGATWNTSDTSPASSNTVQSLQIPTACTVQFGSDQSEANSTNSNSTLAAQGVGWISINGNYTFTFKAKCPILTCSLAYTVGRQSGATYLIGVVLPSVNATPGAGWTTYSIPFSAAETGTTVQGTLQYRLYSVGEALIQDMDVIEGSTLPGNTTAYRDSVVRKLQALSPGSLRFMDGGDWCSNIPDMITAGTNPVPGAAWQVQGNNRACGMNEYVPAGLQVPLGYTDKLQLCVLINTDCWLTIGQFNLPSDWTTLINWLSSQGWVSTFAGIGHKIYLEEGNEAWNSGATGGLWAGGGTTYGHFLGPNMAAAKAATGYNSSVIKLVGDNNTAGGAGPYSWEYAALSVAQQTKNGIPDVMDQAAYTLNDLTGYTTSGSNLSTTGSPFLDEWAEISNLNTHALPSNPSTSIYNNCLYGQTTFGVSCAIYEANSGTGSGAAISQLQLDQATASVGEALYTAENFLLMRRDGGVIGPINTFQLGQNNFEYNCFFGGGCISGVVPPIWGIERYMACGPGQLATCADVDRPISIALQIVNNAIGSNTNLMSITQSGTPTFSYAGGQPWAGAGTNTIAPNSAVPYVNCFAYSNGNGGWTAICFNNNLTTAETVTLAGAGAPTGSVMQMTFPGPNNLITDHNENTYLGASSIAPVVAIPTPTSTSGTTYTIPPASMIALTYSTSGTSTPTATTPTFSVPTGVYAAAQTVTISDTTAGATIYYTTNGTTPTTSSSVFSSAITVSANETLEAIAVETGYANSPVATAVYTISTQTPSFTIASAPSTVSVAQGGSGTSTISVTAVGGFASSVTFTTSGLPSGVTAAFVPNPAGGSSLLTLTASTTAATGTTTVTIIGTSGTLTASTTIALTIGAGGSTITPYLEVNGGGWQVASTATVALGSTVNLGPQPIPGTWSWTGPNGFTSGGREIDAIPLNLGTNTYVATYTNLNSFVSTQTFVITADSVLPAPTFSLAAGTYTSAQSVAIGDATAGTTIFYTTNGTTPSTSSTRYTGAIAVSATETLEAIAVEAGYMNSAAASAAYAIAPVLPAPTFSPTAGTYTTSQSVTIADATVGTTIYYTTNGTAPTTSSSVYGSAISMSATETLEAIAVEKGYTNSQTATAAYTIAPAVPAPTFSPSGGTYTTAQSVTISDTTHGTTIYYTTNSTMPTTASTKYGGPITVSSTETLEAIAVAAGDANAVGTATYTIIPVLPAPTFSVATGTYTKSQSVAIVDATAGTTIYYTTNGTTPSTTSTKYTGPITVGATEKLEAIAVETGHTNSPTAIASYTINLPTLPAPTFTPVAGTYTKPQSVVIGDVTAGTTIYYTTDGAVPSTASTKYSGAITVSATERLQAIAVETGYTDSATASASYTIHLPTLPTPTFAPASGTYAKSQAVKISDATAGATIYYTSNGAVPSTASTKYTGAITVGATETLHAVAVETGYINSPTAIASYTITPLPAPKFTPVAGTYTKSQSVTIGDATAGATIYYTTNGTVPSTGSIRYTGAIKVDTSEKLEAIAVETGYIDSAAAVASYTITPLPAPKFTPVAGTYTKSQSVTIGDATAGTTIYYTTNGAVPGTASTKYTGAITVSTTETLRAIAVETGYIDSAATSASYTIGSSSSAPTVEGFTIAAAPPSATVTPGGSTAFTLTLTPLTPLSSGTSFPAAISMKADGLPGDATYNFSPATLDEGAAKVILNVQMPQTASATEPAGVVDGKLASRIAPLSLGILLLPFARRLRRTGRRLSRAVLPLLLLMATLAVAGLSGCASVSGFLGQTYAVTVTGTSGTQSQSTTVALIVKQ